MDKNNFEDYLISEKLDSASLSKMDNAANLLINANMLMDKPNSEN